MFITKWGAGLLACTGVVLAYWLGHPYRHIILTAEIVCLFIIVTWLYGRILDIEVNAEDHEIRLRAIETIAQRATVVSDARKIVEDALTHQLHKGDTLEDVS